MADEHSFQKEFKKEVERYGGHIPSLVASMFMAGMPDLLITSTTGFTYYTELKFWRNKGDPADCHAMQSLLRGPQIAVIKHTLWKRNALCPIIAQLCCDMDRVCVNYKDKIFFANWKTLAKLMARLDNKENFLELFN
jgi:hypothetical protein